MRRNKVRDFYELSVHTAFFFNIGDVNIEGNNPQNEEDSKDKFTLLGLTECKPVPSPVEFAVDDPLGRWAINRNITYLSGISHVDQSAQEGTRKPLGEQAVAITSTHDQALALRRVTVAAQVHLSRELVLEVLSVLCNKLTQEMITCALEIMGLDDIQLLVNLMRLVARGRAGIVRSKGSSSNLISEEVATSIHSALLKVLGQAVSALICSQPSSAKLLSQVCVKDLMASATG